MRAGAFYGALWQQTPTPTADVAGRQHLRSASQRKLIVPRYRLNSFGRRCFADRLVLDLPTI